ncbi:hypothetical protein Afil01_63990 [Actinorhabdospora filicis]|uniref:Zn-dependent metalloprotease n=1 Tax=Actinorhabdospora filicis TaxID=1785913 RepID=A0A9W6W6I9_9ACTN|nr:M36 family metallopeptidase [Actinorhabdospora filicis]GLZ81592.1 hypothetical protein Afil01_63990 [Actinorhabdospora filicis]
MRLLPRAAMAGAIAAATIAATLVSAPVAQADPAGLTLIASNQSLLGVHELYAQTYAGHPVLGGFYARHTDRETGAVTIQDGRLTVGKLDLGKARVSGDRAATAETKARGHAFRTDIVVVPGDNATLAYAVLSQDATGEYRTVVDTDSGSVLRVDELSDHVDGHGKVFEPNPVATLQNTTLTDQNNKDYAALSGAYKSVTLKNLNGTGKLDGSFANNISASEVKNNTNTFNYNRSQAGFEQVMAYYSITSAQSYIQSLGFTSVNNEAQDFKTTGLTDDNSFYSPSADSITFGTGGVDDAEDAEVIWHEYGHAIQDAQVPGFGSSNEAGAMGEGFGDWFAVMMSIPNNPDTVKTPLACVADWDAVSYASGTPKCLRRVDGTKVYPGDVENEVHADGEIWSRALWDVYKGLGRDQAVKVVLEAQFSYAPNTSFAAAATVTVNTARRLYGASAATVCQNAFHARGIL